MDIIEKIKRGFKENTVYTLKDDGEIMGLPYPYSIPAHRFQALFYCDTYFINLGLIELNQVAVEKVDKELMLKSAKANACFLRIGMG